jgi:hypothetical protein
MSAISYCSCPLLGSVGTPRFPLKSARFHLIGSSKLGAFERGAAKPFRVIGQVL